MKTLFLLTATACIFTCNQGKPVRQAEGQALSFVTGDTLVLQGAAAVFYFPDSIHAAIKKKELGENTFRISFDDYATSAHEASLYLDSVKLPMLFTKNENYLKFIKTGGACMYVRLDTLKEFWGLYLFDPSKEPKSADMFSIEEEYKNYYK